ncbi:MAG: response regulator transcription factor [Candidatus Scalindua sp.]
MSSILVVDDEVWACDPIARFLEGKGYDVIVSHSGEDALEKVKNLKPDLMLLDIRMPGMDGMEVLRRVRQFDDKIGIIMVTAVKDEGIAKDALEKGADEYITKPIDLNYLETSVLVDLTMRKK